MYNILPSYTNKIDFNIWYIWPNREHSPNRSFFARILYIGIMLCGFEKHHNWTDRPWIPETFSCTKAMCVFERVCIPAKEKSNQEVEKYRFHKSEINDSRKCFNPQNLIRAKFISFTGKCAFSIQTHLPFCLHSGCFRVLINVKQQKTYSFTYTKTITPFCVSFYLCFSVRFTNVLSF